jgi:hypothetical protein
MRLHQAWCHLILPDTEDPSQSGGHLPFGRYPMGHDVVGWIALIGRTDFREVVGQHSASHTTQGSDGTECTRVCLTLWQPRQQIHCSPPVGATRLAYEFIVTTLGGELLVGHEVLESSLYLRLDAPQLSIVWETLAAFTGSPTLNLLLKL